MVRIPFKPEFYFKRHFYNCLRWVYNCHDQSCLYIFLRSSFGEVLFFGFLLFEGNFVGQNKSMRRNEAPLAAKAE